MKDLTGGQAPCEHDGVVVSLLKIRFASKKFARKLKENIFDLRSQGGKEV